MRTATMIIDNTNINQNRVHHMIKDIISAPTRNQKSMPLRIATMNTVILIILMNSVTGAIMTIPMIIGYGVTVVYVFQETNHMGVNTGNSKTENDEWLRADKTPMLVTLTLSNRSIGYGHKWGYPQIIHLFKELSTINHPFPWLWKPPFHDFHHYFHHH